MVQATSSVTSAPSVTPPNPYEINKEERDYLNTKIGMLKDINPNDPGIDTLEGMLSGLELNPAQTLTPAQIQLAESIQ